MDSKPQGTTDLFSPVAFGPVFYHQQKKTTQMGTFFRNPLETPEENQSSKGLTPWEQMPIITLCGRFLGMAFKFSQTYYLQYSPLFSLTERTRLNTAKGLAQRPCEYMQWLDTNPFFPEAGMSMHDCTTLKSCWAIIWRGCLELYPGCFKTIHYSSEAQMSSHFPWCFEPVQNRRPHKAIISNVPKCRRLDFLDLCFPEAFKQTTRTKNSY